MIHTFLTSTAHQGPSGKAWLGSLVSLFATATKKLHEDSDKDASAALQSLSNAVEHSNYNIQVLNDLASCSVDEVGFRRACCEGPVFFSGMH